MSKAEKEEEEERPKQTSQGSNEWLIALGVGATVAVAVATTVVIVRSRRQRELQTLRYGSGYQESQESMINRYWNVTVEMFKSAKNIATRFIRGEEVEMSPMTNEQGAYDPHAERDDEEE